jgi:hypothetical protein
MAEERNVGLERATDTSADADPTKAELQRRMEEARESITQTVTEIKDTVVNQYQQVKENISDTLDWREQFRRRPVPFTVGAFAAGALVGYTVMGAFKGEGGEDEDDAFDRIEAGFDRGVQRSYAAQPVIGKSGGAYQRTGRPASNAATESAEVFGRGDYEQAEDVGPDTRPSYSSGYQATAAAPPVAQGLASYASSSPAPAAAEEEEPKGPGLFERFKETKAYDKLQEELSTLGERALEELSKTARNVVVPALLNKVKGLIGLDLSTGGGAQQGGGSRQQFASAPQPSQTAYSGGTPGQTAQTGQSGQAGETTQGAGTSDAANTSARAATGGTEGYGAS